MGAKLTHPQKEVYSKVIQVKGILVGENFHFSKGDVKSFLHWLFKYFPDIMRESIPMSFRTIQGKGSTFFELKGIFQWGNFILWSYCYVCRKCWETFGTPV